MDISEYVTVTDLPQQKDYRHAEDSLGFVVGGSRFLASLSPVQPANYIAILRFVEAEVRGNHYHMKKEEHLIVLEGKVSCRFFQPDNPANQLTFDVGVGQMVGILPGCAHAFTSTTPTACMLELSPQKLDLSDQINCYH